MEENLKGGHGRELEGGCRGKHVKDDFETVKCGRPQKLPLLETNGGVKFVSMQQTYKVNYPYTQ